MKRGKTVRLERLGAALLSGLLLLGIATASRADEDAMTKALMERTTARGRVMATGAAAHGRYLGRVCVLSFRTHQDRIDALVEDFAAVIRELI